jgi:DNA-directed RNA polymerase specialized sigma24 family protein
MLEQELVKRFQQGNDPQAFEELFLTLKNHVYGIAYLILKDYLEAEDIVQDTFLELYVHIK